MSPPWNRAGTLHCWHRIGFGHWGKSHGHREVLPWLGDGGGQGWRLWGLGNDGSLAMESLQMMESFGIGGLEMMGDLGAMEGLQVMGGLEVTRVAWR